MYSEEKVSIGYVPILEELFNEIEEGTLDMDGDECISYYFDAEDKAAEITCVSSYHQLMYLYSNSRE